MATDIGLLDEIVVSGVADGTPRKKLTVSVAKVDAAQLSKVPATSLLARFLRGIRVQIGLRGTPVVLLISKYDLIITLCRF